MDDKAFRRVLLFGELEAVKKAVADEPKRPARANPGGFTPLHVLMSEDRPEVAEVLIEAGASVHARNQAGMTSKRAASEAPPRCSCRQKCSSTAVRWRS
jgi:ankyrin repeat protein